MAFEICPGGRNEQGTAVRQHQDQLKLTPAAHPAGEPKRAALQRMAGPHNSDRRREAIEVGRCVVSSFDRVQHDALMARVARRVHDKRVLKLIRRYLEAGVMDGGLVHATEEGTPQGSPLSPLLSNVMLDDLDWELERRGHRFVRFADDGRIYVKSEWVGQRVMASITQYVEQRLKLKVNRDKSVVDRATKRPFLGFGFFYKGAEVKVRVDHKPRKRAKDRLRELTSRRWGVSMQRRIEEINRYTVGWTAYYSYADTPSAFEELDKWLRRRLRQIRWKEWKRVRTKLRKLRAAGLPEHDARRWAFSRKGYWRIAGSPILAIALPTPTRPTSAWKGSSIPTAVSGMLSEPPGADPHAGWCGARRGELGAYPISRRRYEGFGLRPAVAEITGVDRAWTVSMISELSMPCKSRSR